MNVMVPDNEVLLKELNEADVQVNEIPSYVDLEKFERPQVVAGTRTEPCVYTCGGCRG